MGRKSRGHGAHRPTPGRDTLGALTVSRRFRADKDRDEDAPLHIGSLRLHCAGDSVQQIARSGRQNVKQKSLRAQQKQTFSSDRVFDGDSSESDNVLEDYLSNLQCDSDDSNSYEQQELRMLEQFARVGHQTAVESMQEVAQGLEDTLFDETGSSDDEEDRQTDTSGSESDVSIDDIITDLGGGLSLMERYPVLLNDAPPGSSNSQGANSKPGQKRRGAAVRGANNGKLLPGEKKRLKREKMTAKRAARSAAHGLDLESINAELIHFVASDGDMKGFSPMNKFGLNTVMRLASCYGLKSSAQGSGKKQFVVVASCERTCLPTGEAAAKVKSMLRDQNSAESAMQVVRLGSRTGSRPVRKSFGSGQPQAQRFNQPISFVSSGTVGSDPMEIRPALQQVPLVASSPVAAGAVMKFVTPLAVSPIAPAQDAARHWSASDAQLPQAAEPMQAPVSSQAHTPGAAAEQQNNELSASEAPLAALESTMGDENASLHPGLGCRALPVYAYPEDSHAGLGSQDAVRPLYDRVDDSMLGSAERDVAHASACASNAECNPATADAGDEDIPHGSYIYEKRPGMLQSFMTKQDLKRASKKEQKLARRAQRDRIQQSGQLPILEPTAVATNLHFGKFEQHTTGYGSRMLARWGFAGQGAGLGRAQQGIAEPVAAFVRPKKLGLGHS
ncbi:hypothetical protein ABBQ32_001376 [Trebouxia sp. C0010 RCD-2024]